MRSVAAVALLAACTTRGSEPATGEPTVESLQEGPAVASTTAASAVTTPGLAPSATAGPAHAAAPAPAPAPTATPGQPPAKPAAPPTEPFSGVITTRENKVVPAEIQARVRTVAVHSGQPVRMGQPIVTLDDTELMKQRDQAKADEVRAGADARKAEVDLADARRQLELEKRLLRKGAASKEQIRQKEIEVRKFEALLDSARASYQRATSSRDELESRLAKTILTAPMDGIVSMIRLKEGEAAQPGMAVARVFNPSDLWLRFAAEPEYRDYVRPGAKVTVQVAGLPPINAVVTNVTLDLEPPNQFLVADADIDDATVDKAAVRVGVVGRVSVAGAPAPSSGPAATTAQ